MTGRNRNRRHARCGPDAVRSRSGKRRRSERTVAHAALAMALALAACTTSGPDSTSTEGTTGGHIGTTGAAGIGDPHYPMAGNGGYQVDSYDIDLFYDPDSNELRSVTHLEGTVTSTEGLTRFNLDLQPTMSVSAVSVNGKDADFDHDGAELIITPVGRLDAQSALEVDVEYSGRPAVVRGKRNGAPDGGWYRTDSGGAFAAGEPVNASAWYPVNEHPADTATFAVTAVVPSKWQVISNGVQLSDDLPDPGPGKSVFRWSLNRPVASYQTTIFIDTFALLEDSLSDGTPVISAIGPSAGGTAKFAARTAEVIEFLSDYLGPYPFEAAGGIFTGKSSTGIDLETATRPIYSGTLTDLKIVVHELSHQWFGNAVTLERWSDICINECLASYMPWLWDEVVDGTDIDVTWRRKMREAVDDPGFWRSPLVDMRAGQEFTSVYVRGPLAVHVLRNEMGDGAFFMLLEKWPTIYGGQYASFEDFAALASSVADRDLAPFIDVWFRGTETPPKEQRYPGGLGK